MERRWVPLDALKNVHTQFTFAYTVIRIKFTEEWKDLDFADDIALLSSGFQHMQSSKEAQQNVICKKIW